MIDFPTRAAGRVWPGIFLVALALALAITSPGSAQNDGSGSITVADRPVFNLRVVVAGISPSERAEIVNRRVQRILTERELKPEEIAVQPTSRGTALISLGDFQILEVTFADADAAESDPETLAQRWARRLKGALLEIKPLYRPHEEREVSYLPLLLVSVLAFVVPLVATRAKRFPFPVVVGEIIVGILIGRSGLGLVHYDSWLQFLAEFGFAYLMFLSGLEVDFSLLSAARRTQQPSGQANWRQNPLALALTIFGITLLLAGAIALGLSAAGLVRHPGMMMLVLSTTSLGLVVPILKERGYTATKIGQCLLLAALVADFATMFLITVVAGWLSSGPTLKLFLGLLLIGLFLIALRLGRALIQAKWLIQVLDDLAHATTQVQVRGSLALMLVFVALSEQLGTEVILGAFLAGMLLSLFLTREGSDLHPKLEALGFGFFIPIFFIMVGVRFDLHALVSQPQGLVLAPALILGAFVIKLGAALPLRWIASWRETLAGGFLLSARLSLIIAAAEIGLRLGLFTDTTHSAIICVALVTCMIGPIGFQLLMPRAEQRRRLVVIAGAGEYAQLLGARLAKREWEVRLLEHDPAKIEGARAAGFQVFEGDGTNAEALKQAGIGDAEAFVAATPSDARNEEAALQASRAGVPRRVALIQKGELAARLRAEGVQAVTPLLSTVALLEGMVAHPGVFSLLTDAADDKQISEAVLRNPAFAGRSLRDLSLPGDVLVLSIQRTGEVLIPHGATVLRSGDVVTLIGTDEQVQQAIQRLGA